MADFHVNTDGMTLAEGACRHILERVICCADFRYYMTFTESLARCVAAEAQRRGVEPKDVVRWLEAEIKKRGDQHEPRVRALERRLARAEEGERTSHRKEAGFMVLASRLGRVEQWLDSVRLNSITEPHYTATEAELEQLDRILHPRKPGSCA